MSEDALEADLGTLSDEEWLEGHRALIRSGAIPREELRFLYDPDRDPETVTVEDLTSIIPEEAED